MAKKQAPSSRNIPLPMQREVRQRCGFGCVLCGKALCEYEHLLGWAKVRRHVAQEITLLCDLHHREKESGLLPIAAVRSANDNPLNLRTGISKPYELHYSGNACVFELGTNLLSWSNIQTGLLFGVVVIDMNVMLGFRVENEHLLLRMQVLDKNGRLILQILDNHLAYSTSPWDIQWTGRRLRIRERPRVFYLDARFDPTSSRIAIRHARFSYGAWGFVVGLQDVRITKGRSTRLVRGTMHMDNAAGFVLGEGEAPPAGIRFR